MKFELPEELLINNVGSVWNSLRPVIDKSNTEEELNIDMSSLKRLDGAGLQMMVLLNRVFLLNEIRIKLTGITDSLLEKYISYGYPDFSAKPDTKK